MKSEGVMIQPEAHVLSGLCFPHVLKVFDQSGSAFRNQTCLISEDDSPACNILYIIYGVSVDVDGCPLQVMSVFIIILVCLKHR